MYYYLPLEKSVVLHLIKMLSAKHGWNWLGGSREEEENVKSLQTDRRTTSASKISHELSFLFRWAKNWKKEKVTFLLFMGENLLSSNFKDYIKLFAVWLSCLHKQMEEISHCSSNTVACFSFKTTKKTPLYLE